VDAHLDEPTMRHASIAIALILAGAGEAAAATVTGQCQREGTTLVFVDGLAFESARDEGGTVTTAIYLTTKPIDRKQLATCPDCEGELPVNTFLSTREDWIDAQIQAAAGGWLSASYVGGDMDMAVVNGVDYFAPDGTQTGITAGNERLTLEVNDGKRIAGILRYEEGDYFGATCEGRFDLEVGWPR
jgi:hypothetical protein